jgi:hypothetical protein
VTAVLVDRPSGAGATAAHQAAEDGARGAAARAALALGPLRDDAAGR